MSRAERDYGLPRLTVAEASRILGISPTTFTDWLATEVNPSPQRWTNWTKRDKSLPESLIRAYLTWRSRVIIDVTPVPPPALEAGGASPGAPGVAPKRLTASGAKQTRPSLQRKGKGA